MTSDILITLNTALLGLVGLLLGFVGFFLKDLHQQFKTLVGQVNALDSSLGRETVSGEMFRAQCKEELQQVKARIAALENKLNQ